MKNNFKNFLDKNAQDLKAEFLIPTMTDYFIKSGKGEVEVIPTSSKWFGVTYKEDAPVVARDIKHLVENKEYPENLMEIIVLPPSIKFLLFNQNKNSPASGGKEFIMLTEEISYKILQETHNSPLS